MTDRSGASGADLVTDTLIRLGCKHVFNITGLGMHTLVTSFYRRRRELGYLSHVNETNLALMAQGYARQTRRPAFCFVYQASGTALGMMALTTAWADHAPLVIVSTGSSRTVSGREPYAGLPRSAVEMGAQYAKWSYEVATASRIPEALARAYAIAAEPPMGPVHLVIPCDVYDEIVPETPPRSNFGRTRFYVEDCADETGLARVAEMLVAAERPVLIGGSEIGQLGAVGSLVSLAEALGAPVVLEDAPSYLSFPTTHDQYVGGVRANAALLSQSDAILSIGAEYSEIGDPNEKPPFPPSIPLASLSVGRLDTTRQLWPDIALSGHPRASLTRLAELVGKAGVASEKRARRLAVCAGLREGRRNRVAHVGELDRSISPVPPAQLIEEIRRFCGQDWIVLQGGSTAGFQFDSIYEMDDPDKFHGLSGKASAQGWAGPVSIGIQLAAPQSRVMALIGDGNLMFSATCLWAAAKNKLPMIFVVINNGGWASIPSFMRIYGNFTPNEGAGNEMGWTFGEAPIDYVSLARGLGLSAGRASTADELAEILVRAGSSREPWLIEVATAFDDF